MDDTVRPYRTYMCGLGSRIVWDHPAGHVIPICRRCQVWLETLESLGRKIE